MIKGIGLPPRGGAKLNDGVEVENARGPTCVSAGAKEPEARRPSRLARGAPVRNIVLYVQSWVCGMRRVEEQRTARRS